MRFINKAGLLAGALTTLLILASCSDSDTSTGVTTGKQLANDSSTQVVMHQGTAGTGEHSNPDTNHGHSPDQQHGDNQIVSTSLPVTNTTPSTTPATPATTPTPSPATTPTTTSTTVRPGRQAANDPAPDPVPATPAATPEVTTQVVTTTTTPTTTPVATKPTSPSSGREAANRPATEETYADDVVADITTDDTSSNNTPSMAYISGDPASSAAPSDGEICTLDQHVSANACLPCPDGFKNDAGDDTTNGDTTCEAIVADTTPPGATMETNCTLAPIANSDHNSAVTHNIGDEWTYTCNQGFHLDGRENSDNVITIRCDAEGWTTGFTEGLRSCVENNRCDAEETICRDDALAVAQDAKTECLKTAKETNALLMPTKPKTRKRNLEDCEVLTCGKDFSSKQQRCELQCADAYQQCNDGKLQDAQWLRIRGI